jgi:hypothetical protein
MSGINIPLGYNYTINNTIVSSYTANYYVATTGSDSNPGTFASPFKSLQKLFSVIQAGQLAYIRGGTYDGSYNPADATEGAKISSITGNNNLWTIIEGYPGERPIFDYNSFGPSSSQNKGIVIQNCSYLKFKNFEVTNVKQPTGANFALGITFSSTNSNDHIIFENIDSHHNDGTGFYLRGNYTNVRFLNCDAHDNYDLNTTGAIGGNADGFGLEATTISTALTMLINCRSWNNSDDGFDTWDNQGLVIFDNCWSYHNGYVPGTSTPAGDGNGFKLGRMTASGRTGDTVRIVKNCLAVNNRTNGINQNQCNALFQVYNCTTSGNATRSYWFFTYDLPFILRNNLSYNESAGIFLTNLIHDHNSWDSSVTVTSGDFVSVDDTQLINSRDSVGNLPIITAFHLIAGSDLINAGVEVGLPYNGAFPDMGCFKYS